MWIAVMLLPGAITQAIAAAPVRDRSPQEVFIGVQHGLTVYGSVTVSCNDAGCSDGRRPPHELDGAEVTAELEFMPFDGPSRVILWTLTVGRETAFVPPLSGRIRLKSAALTEAAEREIRRQAASQCSDLSIDEYSAIGVIVTHKGATP